MILLSPSSKIKERFNKVDFKVLSAVYSIIFSSYSNKKYIVKIIHSNSVYSYYPKPIKDIKIYIGQDTLSEKDLHSTLLHEFRHLIQDVVFNIPWTKEYYDDSSTQKYKDSSSEFDCNNFDKILYNKVINIYKHGLCLKSKACKLKKYKK